MKVGNAKRLGATTMIVAAMAGGIGLAGTATAQAAEGTSGDHCVADASAGSVKCFGSENEASDYVSARTVSGRVLVAKLFSRRDYRGATLAVMAPRGCTTTTSDIDYGIPSLVPSHFNDRTSSFKTFHHCDLKGYEDVNYRNGSFRHYRDHDARLTAWNNRISSVRLS